MIDYYENRLPQWYTRVAIECYDNKLLYQYGNEMIDCFDKRLLQYVTITLIDCGNNMPLWQQVSMIGYCNGRLLSTAMTNRYNNRLLK